MDYKKEFETWCQEQNNFANFDEWYAANKEILTTYSFKNALEEAWKAACKHSAAKLMFFVEKKKQQEEN